MEPEEPTGDDCQRETRRRRELVTGVGLITLAVILGIAFAIVFMVAGLLL
jgi:hypothetical protein